MSGGGEGSTGSSDVGCTKGAEDSTPVKGARVVPDGVSGWGPVAPTCSSDVEDVIACGTALVVPPNLAASLCRAACPGSGAKRMLHADPAMRPRRNQRKRLPMRAARRGAARRLCASRTLVVAARSAPAAGAAAARLPVLLLIIIGRRTRMSNRGNDATTLRQSAPAASLDASARRIPWVCARSALSRAAYVMPATRPPAARRLCWAAWRPLAIASSAAFRRTGERRFDARCDAASHAARSSAPVVGPGRIWRRRSTSSKPSIVGVGMEGMRASAPCATAEVADRRSRRRARAALMLLGGAESRRCRRRRTRYATPAPAAPTRMMVAVRGASLAPRPGSR